MLISDVSFVVTDTETTGTSPDNDRLIEIAAVKVRGGEIVGEFSQLINPGRYVPRFITELTGISPVMLYDQPPAGEVLPRFVDFLGDGVLVAHNLSFDKGFIEAEMIRAGLEPPLNPAVCTLRLARRLLSGLKSKGLAGLAEFYQIKNTARHRALGDAAVTAEVLLRFLPRLSFEYGIETLEALVTFQNRRYATASIPKHIRRIREEVLPQLPERPGVYFMKDTRGRVIYIGKAKSLSARVRSYFSGGEPHAEHIKQMVQRVRNVEWVETGSELAALLTESKLIKANQPAFNRASLRYRNRPFIRIDVADEWPKVSLASHLTNDGAEYFGPLGGRGQAETIMEVIKRFYKLRECSDDVFARHAQCVYNEMGQCDAPCMNAEAAAQYAQEVDRVRQFLTGKDHSVLDKIEENMRAAAARMEYEQAATYRNWLQTLETIFSHQRCIATPVLEHNSVLVLPGTGTQTAQLFFVRYGRHVDTVTVSTPPSQTDEAVLRELCVRHFDATMPPPDRYLKQEVDEVRLLAHWMYVYRNATQQVFWRPEHEAEAFFLEVIEAVRRGAAVEPGAEEIEEEED